MKTEITLTWEQFKHYIDGNFISMSKAQIKYKNEVERAGGTYLIVSHMNDLLNYLKNDYSLII